MNFFERQDAARRNSRLLVVLFIVAMAVIVLVIDVAVVAFVFVAALIFVHRALEIPGWVHGIAIVGTIATIAWVSIRKSIELRSGGGQAVAQMMGARRVVPVNATPAERRLLNVVQEMAIASGTRVPMVCVMDQSGGINSFAAGYDGSLCVIVVTRGVLETLNRDELQAVIGHEFSHIVNGDMALNLRMIGILAGLLFIGAAGEHMLRVALEGTSEGSQYEEAGGILGILGGFIVGILLTVVGYAGLVAGRTRAIPRAWPARSTRRAASTPSCCIRMSRTSRTSSSPRRSTSRRNARFPLIRWSPSAFAGCCRSSKATSIATGVRIRLPSSRGPPMRRRGLWPGAARSRTRTGS